MTTRPDDLAFEHLMLVRVRNLRLQHHRVGPEELPVQRVIDVDDVARPWAQLDRRGVYQDTVASDHPFRVRALT